MSFALFSLLFNKMESIITTMLHRIINDSMPNNPMHLLNCGENSGPSQSFIAVQVAKFDWQSLMFRAQICTTQKDLAQYFMQLRTKYKGNGMHISMYMLVNSNDKG